MTEKISCSLTGIHLYLPGFRSLDLLCECAGCGLVTSVAIERKEDGTLSFNSPNGNERYHVEKKSPCRPYAALTQRGSLSILCGQCISTAANKEEYISQGLSEDAGTSYISGKSEGSRCTSRNHEGLECCYPSAHSSHDHEHRKQGILHARWKGDFDGGYYLALYSATPGIDKTGSYDKTLQKS